MSRPEESKITYNVLEDLVRKQNNNELTTILANSEPSELVDSCGNTLLHLAAKYNNVELIKILLNLGYDFNLENSRGATPISVAAINSHLDSLNVLLDITIDIPVGKWIVILKSVIANSSQIPENVTGKILKYLRKYLIDTAEIVDVLIEAGCPLDLSLLMEDSDITKKMLNCKHPVEFKEVCSLLVDAMMKFNYVENVRVILQYDLESLIRTFIGTICKTIKDPNGDKTFAKILINNIATWNLYQHFMLADRVMRIFEKEKKEVVEVFLDCGVDEHFKQLHYTKPDLTISMIQNPNFKISEILRDRKFNPNGISTMGRTALHEALWEGTAEDIEFLLQRGADPNLENVHGFTIMFYFGLAKYAILFLKYGADVQTISKNGQTIFGKSTEATPLYLAHLAMLEARGVSVKPVVRDAINSEIGFKNFYAKCSREIDWLKKQIIYGRVTYFTVLTGDPRKLSSSIRCKDTVIIALSQCFKRGIYSYYYDTLQINFNDALKIFNLKSNAAEIISECSEIFEPEHLVIDIILSFLTLENLQMFA